MSRIRYLKPGFFTNPDLSDIDPLGRLLFQALWCLADRAGRLEDNPKRIKAESLPYDACDVDALLDDLARPRMPHTPCGFITRYAVDGLPYIQVNSFEQHQHPHSREQPSTIPAPPRNGPGPNGQHADSVPITAKVVTSHYLGDDKPGSNGEQIQIREGGQIGGGSRAARDEPPPPLVPPDIFQQVSDTLGITIFQDNVLRSLQQTLLDCADEPDPAGEAIQAMGKMAPGASPGECQAYFRKWLLNLQRDRKSSGKPDLKVVKPEDIPDYDTGNLLFDQICHHMARRNLIRQLPCRDLCNWEFEHFHPLSFEGDILTVSVPADLHSYDAEFWPGVIAKVAKNDLDQRITVQLQRESHAAAG